MSKELDELWGNCRTLVKESGEVCTREDDDTVTILYPDFSRRIYKVGTDDEGPYWYCEKRSADGQWGGREDSDELGSTVFTSEEEALLDAHRSALAE